MAAIGTVRPWGGRKAAATARAATTRAVARAAVATLPLAAAPVALLAVRNLDIDHLGDYGLPPELPAVWYASLALLVLGAGRCLVARPFSGGLTSAYTVALVAVLYGTVPVAADAPQYPWVYKHIGVTRFIELHGSVNWTIDIYHRWPGFFAGSAFASWVSGEQNPIAYVAWAEPLYMWVAAVLLAAVVRMLTGRARAGWGAALVFVSVNWVGQTYYSPQALGLVLALAIFAVLLRQLGQASLTRPGRVAERWVMAMGGSSPDDTRLLVPVGPAWRRWQTIGLVLLLYVVIVVSHQLTPYMVVYGVTLLVWLCGLRPRWLPLALLAIALGYLSIHWSYIRDNFGVLTSIDPFSNVKVPADFPDVQPLPGRLWTWSGLAPTAVVLVAALCGAVILVRRRLSRVAVLLGCLAGSPVLLVLGQNYGGEASLRVLLFAFPWASALAFAAFDVDLRGSHRRRLARHPAALLFVLVVLFIPAFYGKEELRVVSADTVAAAAWLDAHAEPGSVVMRAAPGFPVRGGAHYEKFTGPASDDAPNLMSPPLLRHPGSTSLSDVDQLVTRLRQYSDDCYLVFGSLQERYAHVFRLVPDGGLRDLESAVVRSHRFAAVFANSDVRIYRLVVKG